MRPVLVKGPDTQPMKSIYTDNFKSEMLNSRRLLFWPIWDYMEHAVFSIHTWLQAQGRRKNWGLNPMPPVAGIMSFSSQALSGWPSLSGDWLPFWVVLEYNSYPCSLCKNSFGGYCPPFLHLKPSLHTPILFRFGLEDNKSVKKITFFCLLLLLHISLVFTFALASRKLSHVLYSIIETMLHVSIVVFAVAFPSLSFSL